MSIIIGIDLGTSTTEAAVYRNGQMELLPNPDGSVITPSAVGIDPSGNWVVGEKARAQYLLYPENTAIEVKRKTGTSEKLSLGTAKYTPVELQAKLLSYVRSYASEYLGENVDRAVISVPAYFNDVQRRETIRAGELAGFTVERILNEPTAAALSYGLDHLEEESHVLVYDLGGGTFDVTLLEMFDGALEVKASGGDNQLGGKDFDERLMEHLFTRFQAVYGKNLRKDRRASARIKEEAEKCKIALSSEESYRVLIPAICVLNGSPVELDETVTREQFESMTCDLLQRTHDPIDTVLADANLSEAVLDHIILVGGSTRMPMIARDIQDYLGKEASCVVHPEYAVAEGAAIQAGMISGEIDPAEGLIMTDVNPYTLGIRTADGSREDCMSVIIPRNVTIPVTRTERYCTYDDYQTKVLIEVYQGESSIASHNHLLGQFRIRDIPARRAGEETLDVSFSYDLNGLLKVSAVLVSTGAEKGIEIDLTNTQDSPDLSRWKEAENAKAYRTVIRTAERLLSKPSDIPEFLRDDLRTSLDALKLALVTEDSDAAEDAEAHLSMLLEIVRDEA
ncbi:MAG: Hsp70 family protein [Oscillospiraceae bacterium]|nr:Hsp70 family protein [Oscillospiraceae bacterium]